MTTRPTAVAPTAAPPLTCDDAYRLVASRALRATPVGRVGLELEFHLVALDVPARRVPWSRLTALLAELPILPGGSRVTVEPGGQVELSTPPLEDVVAAVQALRRDRQALGDALRAHRLGLACVGADPARPAVRSNPASRYAAMETHLAATGSGSAGRSMMCSTASLQVNVEAGLRVQWPRRVSLLHQLGPVLVALSACSPWLAGYASGWRSMRQQVWGEIDQRRCGPLLAGAHPEDEWADYALSAPVMLVRDPLTGHATPVTRHVPFAAWLSGTVTPGGRAPTADDLDYHLTTLFPPVRPRGFLEMRCLDAVPDRWWGALAVIAVTLLDDPVAADAADAATQPLDGAWTAAAQDGLADPVVGRAARLCTEIAVARCPAELKAEVEAYAELVADGRTPGDELRARIDASGPLAALEECARA
jgi:ergothioneine biosynthesis glutamate--cysteine ligase EgtA